MDATTTTTTATNPIDTYALERIRFRVERLIGKFGLTSSDRDDLMQDFALHLLEAMPRFDPKRSSRNTFICCVLDSKMRSLIRYQTAQKRDWRRERTSIHEMNSDHPIFDESTQRHRLGHSDPLPPDHVDLSIDLRDVLDRMPEPLPSVARVLISHPHREAARVLGVNQTRFQQLVRDLQCALMSAGFAQV